jgi:1-deoxy-D-xylulose-5-phosphate synthase
VLPADEWSCPLEEVKVGTGRKLHDGTEVAVITIGPIGNDIETVIKEIETADPDNAGKVAHYDIRFLKPLDEHLLTEIGERFTKIITVEDGERNGGMGSAVLEWMADHGYKPTFVRLGLPDEFVEHGTVDELRKVCGIDNESLRKQIEILL